jgi:NitT/TauT family transport system substrate-binding protein
MRLRRIASTIAIIVLSCVLIACSPSQNNEAAVKPLKLGINKWAGWSSIMIAQEKGFFDQQNVKVDIVQYDSQDTTNTDFAGRKIDMATGILTDTVVLANAGIPVQLVWVFDNSAGADVIVGKADIATPQDLKDKRIGVGIGTFSQLFVIRALAAYGLKPIDVTLINVREDQIQQAIADGKIDAGHTWEPYLSAAVQAGNKVIGSSKDTPGVIADILMVQNDELTGRNEEVVKIVRAIQLAGEWWQANPDEGNKIAAQFLEVSPESMVGIVDGIKRFTLQDNLTAFDLSGQSTESLIPNATSALKLFQSIGLITQTVDLTAIIQPSIVNSLSSLPAAG